MGVGRLSTVLFLLKACTKEFVAIIERRWETAIVPVHLAWRRRPGHLFDCSRNDSTERRKDGLILKFLSRESAVAV